MNPSASFTRLHGAVAAGVVALSLAQVPSSWPVNLLQNPDGSAGTVGWLRAGDAAMGGADYDGVFVVRNGGSLQQRVDLPPGSEGKFLVVVGRSSSERVNADGSITGRPYLSGMIYAGTGPRILAYLQGESMRLRTDEVNRWGAVSGVFPIAEGAGSVSIKMGQGARVGDPQNGSAARFDDLGLFVLATEAEARTFENAIARVDLRPRLLPPPLDDAIQVTPFDSSAGVILPEAVALELAMQCSRRSPGPVRGLWTPTSDAIAKFEAALAPVLVSAQRQSPLRNAAAMGTDYLRQYVGFVIDGRRVIYVNALAAPPAGSAPRLDWKTRGVRTCDGGARAFGAEYDVEAGKIISFEFNGAR